MAARATGWLLLALWAPPPMLAAVSSRYVARSAALGALGRPHAFVRAPRARVLASDDGRQLSDVVERLRNETEALRAEVQEMKQLNEFAKPRPPPPPPPAPVEPSADGTPGDGARAVEEKARLDLPFNIKVETEVQKRTTPPPRGGGGDRDERQLLQLDLEFSNLEPLGRLGAVAVYLVPLLDGASLAPPVDPWIPLLQAASYWNAVPFGTLGFFILVSSLSQNYALPFGLRYNMRQAIILDIIVSLPWLIAGLVDFVTKGAVGLPTEVQSALFYALMASIGYCTLANVVGFLPKGIPFISDAADSQSGPRW